MINLLRRRRVLVDVLLPVETVLNSDVVDVAAIGGVGLTDRNQVESKLSSSLLSCKLDCDGSGWGGGAPSSNRIKRLINWLVLVETAVDVVMLMPMLLTVECFLFNLWSDWSISSLGRLSLLFSPSSADVAAAPGPGNNLDWTCLGRRRPVGPLALCFVMLQSSEVDDSTPWKQTTTKNRFIFSFTPTARPPPFCGKAMILLSGWVVAVVTIGWEEEGKASWALIKNRSTPIRWDELSIWAAMRAIHSATFSLSQRQSYERRRSVTRILHCGVSLKSQMCAAHWHLVNGCSVCLPLKIVVTTPAPPYGTKWGVCDV